MTKPREPIDKAASAKKKIEIETNDRSGGERAGGGQKPANSEHSPAGNAGASGASAHTPPGGKKKQTDEKQTAEKQTAAPVENKENVAAEPTADELLKAEKDKYLRLAAEYDNFRKRTAKERDAIYSNAKADVITKLLPVHDNLERALKMECADEAYYKGIEMTMLQLTEILKNMGVSPIAAEKEQFDPNLHNAIMRIEDPNLGKGIIAEECKKGFMMGERILRFSDVVVAN